MASIAIYTKTFNSGTNGADASGAFSVFAGTTVPLYTNAPALEGAESIRFTIAAGTTSSCLEQDTGRGLVYRLFMVRLEATPTANVYIMTCWNNGTPGNKVADLRVNTDRTLTMRDNITARFTGTVPLALNTTYFVSLKVNPAAATMFVKLYDSSGILLEGSPALALTSTTEVLVDNFRWGVPVSGSAMTWVLDNLKGDDAVELFPPSTGVVANAGPDQSNKAEGVTVTLTGSASGGTNSYTYAWAQTAGTSVTLTGTGASRTYVVPSLASAETATFQLTATDTGSVVGTDSVNVGTLSKVVPNAGVDQSGITAGSTVTLTASASGGSGTGFVYTWSQLAGTTVTLAGTGATRTYTAPTLASAETETFRVSVTDSLGSTAKMDTVDVGVLASTSSNISAYTKTFNGGTNGASASAAFDTVTGVAPTYTTSSPLEGNSSVHFVTTATNSTAIQTDSTTRPVVWRLFRILIHTRPTTTTTGIIQWYQSASIVGSLRITSAGLLNLRDFNTTSVFTGTHALTNDTMYFIALKVIPGTSTGHRYKLYDSTGTLVEDSGDKAATAAGLSTVDNFHLGILTNETMDLTLDDTRGDSQFELFPPSTVIVPNAGADQTNKAEGTTVALSASATGGIGVYTYAWAQLTGPAVSLSGSGANRTFIVPAGSAATATFRVTVNDGVNTAQTDDVAVGLLGSIVPNAGSDQTNVDAYSTVTLTASASGGSGTGYVYTWTQLSGTTVTLAGTGTTRTFTAGALPATETPTFRVSVTDSLGSTAKTDDVAITIIQHDNFTKIGGVTVPYQVWERQSGAWVS